MHFSKFMSFKGALLPWTTMRGSAPSNPAGGYTPDPHNIPYTTYYCFRRAWTIIWTDNPHHNFLDLVGDGGSVTWESASCACTICIFAVHYTCMCVCMNSIKVKLLLLQTSHSLHFWFDLYLLCCKEYPMQVSSIMVTITGFNFICT